MNSWLAAFFVSLMLVLATRAAPGDVEADFNPLVNGEVVTATLQPDGKMLLGGAFTTVGGVTRNRIARLNGDGTLDAGFNPDANDSVRSFLVQANGKILISGMFTTIGGTTRVRMARLNADGTLDPGFNASVSDWINCMVEQPDGKILLGGEFWTVNGVNQRRLARLNPDGSIDLGFNPIISDWVRNVQLEPSGRIVIGGEFWTVNGVTRNYSARLNADGSLDPDFNPNANNPVRSTTIQADGKILIGGDFTAMGGIARNRLARFHADGSLDTAFDPNCNGTVRTLVEQADRKLLIGGGFTTVGAATRNRIARLNADGTVDLTFDPNASDSVRSIAIQTNGKIVLGGTFLTVGGISRANLARLDNDAATQTLSVPHLNRIEWQRGGSSPETREVTFEVSVDGGASYAPWGAGTRIAGGWERLGNGANLFTAHRSLPASGQVRARARTVSGYYSGSRGLVESVAAFSGVAVPEVVISGNSVEIIDADADPELADGTHFGDQSIATGPVVHTFTIQNTGTADLVLGPIAISGYNPADFTVTVPPTSPIPAGGSTSFQVAFDPSATDARSAHIAIPTNDFNEYYFQFAVTGVGLSNDAKLSNLTPSVGTPLNPAFTSATTTYTSRVSYDTSSMTFTPTAAHGGASITVNGNAVPSGSASAGIALSAGPNLVTVEVTAQDGVAKQTYTVLVSRAAFAPGGNVDLGFNLNLTWHDNFYFLERLALQPDGKIITSYIDWSVSAAYGVLRWHADGTADAEGGAGLNSYVHLAAVQADGRILVGGEFSYTNRFGQPGMGIIRLHANGALDETFHPVVYDSVSSAAVQADGKILIVGGFISVDGVPRNQIARLHADGTLDTDFTPDAPGVAHITLQTDGRILIGGTFTTVAGVTRKGIARLNSDGTLDPGFTANTNDTFNGYTHDAGEVTAIAVQADGKILMTGKFTAVNGVPRNGFARLNPDGTLDAGFMALNFAYGCALTITPQTDGEILIGGDFFLNGSGVQRNGFARLHSDGTLDTFFNPAPNGAVLASLLQPDGKILIAGTFSAVGGASRHYIARLDNVPATQTLSAVGPGRIEWLRGGSSPEAHQVTFEASTHGGAAFVPLGHGLRIAGGWELTGLNLPPGGLLRARARTGSGSLVETISAFGVPSARQLWETASFGAITDIAIIGDEADPDHDGETNFLEFATGQDPLAQTLSAHALTLLESSRVFTYQRNKAALSDGLVFTVETTETLAPGSWIPVGAVEEILADDGALQTVQVVLPSATTARQFARLRVSLP